MKLINKNNFISIVCVSFTLVVCGKLLLEKITGFTDRYYTENIFTCLCFCVIITSVLALHFYLQKFPLIPVLIGQYIIVLAAVFGYVSLADMIAGTETNAIQQMILSVTIPFIVGAFVYYLSFFRQIAKANDILAELASSKNNDSPE